MNFWRRCLLTSSLLLVMLCVLFVASVNAGTVAQNASEGVPGYGLMCQYPPDSNYSLYAQRFGFAIGSCAYFLAQEDTNDNYFPFLNLVKSSADDSDSVSYSYISSNHPEWFMTYKDGSKVVDGGYYMLDIGNPACVDYIISWTKQAMSGWASKFIGSDNGCWEYADSNWSKYGTNQSYQDAWAYFLGRLSDAFRPEYKIVFNVGTCDEDVFERMMSYLDGVNFESMGRTANDLAWIQEESLSRGKWLTDHGKIWNVRLCDYNTEADFLFGYAVVAMVGGPLSYFDMKNENTTFYFPEMNYDMGSPLGDMKQIATGVYERDFQNYNVYLNLSNSSCKLPNGSTLASFGGAIIKASSSPPTTDYSKYTFTYSYNGGAGDYYSGYLYALTGKYSVGYTLAETDENGQACYYTITSATSMGSDGSKAGQVYVTSYYDKESGNTYVPVNSGTVVGSNYLGSEHDYIIQSGTSDYLFGYYNGIFYEADLPASNGINAYSFKLSYSDGDYYTGTVYAPSTYGYSVGYTKTVTDEKRHTDTYTITGVTGGYDPGLAGQVYVSNYYDSGGRKSYTPMDSTIAIGTNYLGSEHDYVIMSGIPAYLFGSSGGKFYEADLVAYAYSFKLSYADGDYYTGTVYAAPEYGYSTAYTKTVVDEKGQTDTYTITGLVSNTEYSVSKAGQVYVARYYDKQSNKIYTPVNSTSVKGTKYLSSEYGYIVRSGVLNYLFGFYNSTFYEADYQQVSRR